MKKKKDHCLNKGYDSSSIYLFNLNLYCFSFNLKGGEREIEIEVPSIYWFTQTSVIARTGPG